MIVLFRTLSASYLVRHPGKTLLAVVGVAVGVAAVVAVLAAQETLTSGLRTTVDRVAGRADLQITADGGVPESLREAVRQLEVVDAEAPVIEQVVQPESVVTGGLLVVAVDLVGDHVMRPYAFADEDADVDDPLLFLAQPDSLALSRSFAARAGLRKGDRLTVRIAGVTRAFTIRALLDPRGFAGGYGGNLAVTDVYAAEDLFGRGRRFDRLDVRVRPGSDLEQAAESIRRAIGPGYRVESPDRRGVDLANAAQAVTSAFDVVTVVAFWLGLFLISTVFAIGVERRRRAIGIVRTIGATPTQVWAVLLIEAAVLGAIGGAGGLALGGIAAGRLHAFMGSALQAVHGLGDDTPSHVTMPVAMAGLLMGLLGSVASAWLPARRAAAIRPFDATSTGVFASTDGPVSPWAAVGGVVLLVLAWWSSRSDWIPNRLVLPVVMVLATLGSIAVAGHAARAVIRVAGPLLTRLVPAAGRIASNTLLSHPRRTASSAATLMVLAAFALGVAGFLRAVRAGVDGWVESAVLSDLVVRGAAGFGVSSVHLAADLTAQVAALPGVRMADALRNQRVDFRGRSVTLTAFDGGGVIARTNRTFIAGSGTAFDRLAADHRLCVVSDVFARRFGMALGDELTLDSPSGPVRLSIAAVVASFRGMIMIDRALFAERWGDDRIDAVYVALQPGADPGAVRDAIRSRLGSAPALISTRQEVVGEWNRALATLDRSLVATVSVALVIAILGSVTTLVVPAAERARETGMLRAIGATPRQVSGSGVVEALTLTAASLALAVPLGEALAWFLRVRLADMVANFRFPAVYPAGALMWLVAGLPLAAIAATWMPLRWATGRRVTEAISYD